MLERKFASVIEDFLLYEQDKVLLVNGARQIGKSFLIRHVGQKLFENFVEINLQEDKEGPGVFENVKSTDDLYIRLSNYTSLPLGNKNDTLVFLDEIQCYPHILTMLKFLNQEGRYRFIASGSELGIALARTPSVPLGSVTIKEMYPLDFEEFLWATGISRDFIKNIEKKFKALESLDEGLHSLMIKRFQYYLLTGGLPECVNAFIADRNIIRIRQIQTDIHILYGIDASQYDIAHKLRIRKIYDLIPSNLENKKKRVVYKEIEDKKGKTFSDYENEFEYLTNSGIAIEVSAISNPRFPLLESEQKKLVKLYLNDVGILTDLLYGLNVNAILENLQSINLGTVYESVVAQELHAHGYKLHYYDNKQKGEVDFLIDDYENLSVLPIEVKSGKDYTRHRALTKFISNPDYGIKRALVLSNKREVTQEDRIIYLPVYFVMFLQNAIAEDSAILPELPMP